ncbi:hypothetical protein CYMTET_53101 [Cymbomonas tetramitiformis]|uniref:Uncharacterized protein n=1 Tax=Cymbomonas tetramitiformis TaxID=36881 RepID=A0AAE0BIU2_9CHLO|nr:hypothetical protein CYMTET_53101 [Cymbomonas tetramitiformis]
MRQTREGGKAGEAYPSCMRQTREGGGEDFIPVEIQAGRGRVPAACPTRGPAPEWCGERAAADPRFQDAGAAEEAEEEGDYGAESASAPAAGPLEEEGSAPAPGPSPFSDPCGEGLEYVPLDDEVDEEIEDLSQRLDDLLQGPPPEYLPIGAPTPASAPAIAPGLLPASSAPLPEPSLPRFARLEAEPPEEASAPGPAADYDEMAPVPAPEPSEAPAPLGEPAPDIAPPFPSTPLGTLTAAVTSTVTFSELSYSDLANDPTAAADFEAGFVAQMAASAGVEEGDVAVTGVAPGSTQVASEVLFTGASAVQQAGAFADVLEEDVQGVFTDPAFGAYGNITMARDLPCSPTPFPLPLVVNNTDSPSDLSFVEEGAARPQEASQAEGFYGLRFYGLEGLGVVVGGLGSSASQRSLLQDDVLPEAAPSLEAWLANQTAADSNSTNSTNSTGSEPGYADIGNALIDAYVETCFGYDNWQYLGFAWNASGTPAAKL